MSLDKQSTRKKMTFGSNTDLPKVLNQKDNTTDRIKRVNVNFEESKHARLKSACANKGTSITEVINELVEQWLRENE